MHDVETQLRERQTSAKLTILVSYGHHPHSDRPRWTFDWPGYVHLFLKNLYNEGKGTKRKLPQQVSSPFQISLKVSLKSQSYRLKMLWTCNKQIWWTYRKTIIYASVRACYSFTLGCTKICTGIYHIVTWPQLSYVAEDRKGRIVGYVLAKMYLLFSTIILNVNEYTLTETKNLRTSQRTFTVTSTLYLSCGATGD